MRNKPRKVIALPFGYGQNYPPAHERLANLLDSLGDSAQARYHRERSRRAAEKLRSWHGRPARVK